MPLPKGFGRKGGACVVAGSVTDHCGYAPSPSPSIRGLCDPNDRCMDSFSGSLGKLTRYTRRAPIGFVCQCSDINVCQKSDIYVPFSAPA
jgi:hypothetical protein